MDISTILQFFDLSRPCPDNIKDCNILRDEYIREVNSFSTQCKECDRLKIRDRYIERIKL
jgi:hypothetical protein